MQKFCFICHWQYLIIFQPSDAESFEDSDDDGSEYSEASEDSDSEGNIIIINLKTI